MSNEVMPPPAPDTADPVAGGVEETAVVEPAVPEVVFGERAADEPAAGDAIGVGERAADEPAAGDAVGVGETAPGGSGASEAAVPEAVPDEVGAGEVGAEAADPGPDSGSDAVQQVPVFTPVPVTAPDFLVDLARAAAEADAEPRSVGGYRHAIQEDPVAVTLTFAATLPGYAGWGWSVTVATVPGDEPTVSEIALLPQSEAVLPPQWVPWSQRVRPEDLGPGDLLPTSRDDDRMVPGYVLSDDPAVAALAAEVGLGRPWVMSRDGRLDAADRWDAGPFSAGTEMATQAPAPCGTCAFYLPLAGSLGGAFGACGNAFAPADGRVVAVAFGCGAHSDVVIEDFRSPAPADVVIDELRLEVHERVR